MVWLGSRTNRMQEVIPVKHRSPYSLVDVNAVCVESLITTHRGRACALGVDVAKGELVTCLVSSDRSFARPWRVSSPQQVRLFRVSVVSQGLSPRPTWASIWWRTQR